MKTKINIILIAVLLLTACNQKKEAKPINSNAKPVNTETKDTLKTSEIAKSNNASFNKIMDAIKLKKTPLVDSTNFDNFNKTAFFNKQEVNSLKLEKIYPEFYKQGYNYKATASYKIQQSQDFHTVVLTTYKGDQEMESTLIIYNLNGELIDFKIISYDEIAEGISRITSKIENNTLTITSVIWLDEKQENIEIFTININGKIKPILDN